MSSSFDRMSSWFLNRFEPKSGDEYEKHLFHMIIQEMHSANHDFQDQISRNSGVMRAVSEFGEFLKEEKNGKEKS